MTQEEYLKNFETHIEEARKAIVWYILKKDWYIDKTNDSMVREIDKTHTKIYNLIKNKWNSEI